MNDVLKYQELEYFCSKCKRYHTKYRKHCITKIYKEHYQFKLSITKSEAFKLDFKKKWNNYGTKLKKQQKGDKQ